MLTPLLTLPRQAAKKSEDAAAEGQACYRLGRAYINSKSQYDVAIKYLMHYELTCSQLKVREGFTRNSSRLQKPFITSVVLIP
jgi:hypothetical protein